MRLPNQIIKRDSIDPKLAVGSSLPNPKGLFSIVFALYLVNDEKDHLDFSIKNGSGINLKPSFIPMLKSFFSGINGYSDAEIESLETDNPLLAMQIEPLQVPLQLFWKIAKINIVGTDSSSGERTGGVRFPKELFFTTNIDIVKYSISDENDMISNNSKELIYSWLFNKSIQPSLQNIELKLIKILSIFSEETLFKTWDNTTEIIFQQEGIYQSIDSNNPKINIKGTKEIKGTLRNLKSSIDKNLHPFLITNGDDVELKSAANANIFSYYKNKVSNYLDLSPKSVEIKTIDAIDEVNLDEHLADNQEVIFSKSLRTIIFESFKYVKSTLDESNVLANYEIKDCKIEDRSYKGITLPKYFNFEVFIGLFNDEQTINNLKSSGTIRFIDEKIRTLDFENSYFTSQWNEANNRGLSLGNFNNFLKDVSNNTLEIIKDNEIFKLIKKDGQKINSQNTIYYGSPGTGKSHKADEITNGKDVKKVTFHPDYDYHSFVGGYKPTMNGDKIAYKFVPQIITKIYVDAWKNLVSTDETKPFYLQIEEINRGNCAEIFGDLFQLLDRKSDGSSRYEITAEEELYKYLLSADGFGGDHEGIKDGKLRFPNNLKIIATMNTSDQSLFPMDSAFKRRWDWIYVPIDYNCSFSDFTIKLDNGKAFEWLSFLKIINEEIFEITKSQDKQIGNWFIDAQNSGKVITESTFVNKVIFYLWNDVFKDEENTIFKSADGKNLTYTSFFEKGTSNNLVSYILEERLKLIDVNKAEPTTTEGE